MSKESISHSRLLKALHYDPETGVFTRKKRSLKFQIGSIAAFKSTKGYLRVFILNEQILAHRLAWFYTHKKWPDQIDHINHCREDNRLCNLRNVTHMENHMNMSMSKRNKTGCTGISKTIRGNWACEISHSNGRFRKIFKNFHKAVAVRKALEVFYDYHPNHGNSSHSQPRP